MNALEYLQQLERRISELEEKYGQEISLSDINVDFEQKVIDSFEGQEQEVAEVPQPVV